MTTAILKQVPMVRFLRDGRVSMDTEDDRAKAFIRACMYDENRAEVFARGIFCQKSDSGWYGDRRDYMRRISDYTIPKQWTIARRGFGKTTMLLWELVRVLCLRRFGFVLFTSNEQGLSEDRTEAIRSMLITTPELVDLFGRMRPNSVDGMKEVFGAKSWRLTDPFTNEPFAAVVPKSENQTVNGMLLYVNGAMRRPDYLINDDGESRNTIHNEDLRKEHRDWMSDVLFQTVDQDVHPSSDTRRWMTGSPMDRVPWVVRVMDTNKHPDAYIVRLSESQADGNEWDGKVYPIADVRSDGTFKSRVPNVSDAQVANLHKSFAGNMNEAGFWREHMGITRTCGENLFPVTFQRYKESELLLNESRSVERFIVVDPALTPNAKSAFSSMLAVAVDMSLARIYLRRQITERLTPSEFDDKLFKLAQDMNTQWIMVEGLGQNNFLQDNLALAAMKRGLTLGFESLSTSTGNIVDVDFRAGGNTAKQRRAVFALRMYQPFEPTHPQGHVWHEESMRDTAVENQMHSYPQCNFWDALDCLGHVPQAMRKRGIYFEHQELADAGEEKRESHVIMMGRRIAAGEWRVC